MAKQSKSQTVLESAEKSVTNRQLQAAIQTINELINAKTNFSASNGYKIMTLATALEDAFRPAAKMLEDYRKDAQAEVEELVKPFEGNQDKFNADKAAVAKMSELNTLYTSKTDELMAIGVVFDSPLLEMNVFKDRTGSDVDMSLGALLAIKPFIKG